MTNPTPPQGITCQKGDLGKNVLLKLAPDYEPKKGYITTFNDTTVFVRFGNASTAQACRPADLDWAT